MNTAKKIMYALSAGVILGAVVGILYAPSEGADTRRKINRLKKKLGLADEDTANLDRETLQELKSSMHRQLKKIDLALEKAE